MHGLSSWTAPANRSAKSFCSRRPGFRRCGPSIGGLITTPRFERSHAGSVSHGRVQLVLHRRSYPLNIPERILQERFDTVGPRHSPCSVTFLSALRNTPRGSIGVGSVRYISTSVKQWSGVRRASPLGRLYRRFSGPLGPVSAGFLPVGAAGRQAPHPLPRGCSDCFSASCRERSSRVASFI